MLKNIGKILDDNRNSHKKDPSNVHDTQQKLQSCIPRIHGANDKDSAFSRVTLSSRPQSRNNSVSSCQTEPNPITTIQKGASNLRLQNSVVNQENLDLKNEIAELRNQVSVSNQRIDQLQHICACIIPYLGAEWPDVRQYMDQYKTTNELEQIKSGPQSLMFRHNQLEQEVLMLKNCMENRVDVNKTASGCDNPSASQRFVHEQTPVNLNKGVPLHIQGQPKPTGMDIEYDAKRFPL